MVILVYAATFDMKKIDMFVVDKDMSTVSRELVNKFEGSPFYVIHEASFDTELGEEALYRDEADIVLVIPNDFEEKLIVDNSSSLQLLINAIDGNSAQLVYGYSNAIIMDYNKNLIAEWKGIPEFKTPGEIMVIENYWYNSLLDYKWYMAPGILAILVTIIGMFLSGMNLVREKEIGTIEQLNVTPIRKHHFIIGKLLPFLFIALFDLGFGLLIARFLFDLPIVGSLWLMFGFGALYLLGVLGIGLLLSTITNTQQQVMFVGFFFMMIFILMGGIFTPVESMPEWAQMIDRVNPVYYFMKILRMILLKGSGFGDLIQEFVSLTIIGVSMLMLAIWRYRKTT
jgi:ABC-2 type transport system permease protein